MHLRPVSLPDKLALSPTGGCCQNKGASIGFARPILRNETNDSTYDWDRNSLQEMELRNLGFCRILAGTALVTKDGKAALVKKARTRSLEGLLLALAASCSDHANCCRWRRSDLDGSCEPSKRQLDEQQLHCLVLLLFTLLTLNSCTPPLVKTSPPPLFPSRLSNDHVGQRI